MYYFFFLLFVPAGVIIPVRWILRLWLEDRAITPRLGLCGLACHFFIVGYLISHMLNYLVFYCGLIIIAIALMKVFGPQTEWRMRKQIADEDIAKYKRKLERFPENAALHSALANVYMDCRRYDEAIEEYRIAIDLDPDRSNSERWRLKEALEENAKRAGRLKKRGQSTGGGELPTEK
jgi:tetratricopeptide (TPR) repeat protein